CAMLVSRRGRSWDVWWSVPHRQWAPPWFSSLPHSCPKVDRARAPLMVAAEDQGMQPDRIPNVIVEVGAARFGNALPLTLIAGPCALESRAHALEMAAALKEIAGRLKIGLVYKTSFDKANRTSAKSARGIGLEQ